MKLKKVIRDEELNNKIKEAIDILCPAVKSTLGPKGCNVIINHSSFCPFITNDGVTIASNIESDDKCINTILELIKEASIKTNETVGDGTTTTIVLFEAIYTEGKKLIDEGFNPIILKQQLDECILNIEKMIISKSKTPAKNELINVANISGNSNNIGTIISDVFFKIKNKDAIEIITSNNKETKIEYSKGYIIDTNLASPYYFKDNNKLEIKDANILLIDGYLDDINCLSSILNHIIINNKELIIIADDYSEEFIDEVLNFYINEKIKIYLFKNPEYGDNKYRILKDIKAISNSKILENLNYESQNDLGVIKSLTINKDKTIFKFKKNKYIEKRILEIKSENDDSNPEFTNKRLAMFENGLATISVGSDTILETRELKMRFDDALCAINCASSGILPGCGLVFLELSDKIELTDESSKILKNSLRRPFEQIIINSGLNKEKIYETIKNSNYKKIYNITRNTFEDVNSTSVMDSTSVIINSLRNACSIASMLLEVSSLIINEYPNNLDKIDDYNNL